MQLHQDTDHVMHACKSSTITKGMYFIIRMNFMEIYFDTAEEQHFTRLLLKNPG